MSYSKVSLAIGLTASLWLSGCSFFTAEPPSVAYSKTAILPLYKLEHWSFDGRLSITSQKDSWTANTDWQHNPDKDTIKLSGPLGQGATLISLSEGVVTIDKGNGEVQSSNTPEAFITQQLGMPVPVQSLRYWLIGLPEPNSPFIETATGFKQAGWLVDYKQMQTLKTSNIPMPHRIDVFNEQVKLKLIIDEWAL